MTNTRQLALDAAKIAIALHEHRGEVVLRAADYEDVHAAVSVALEARKYPSIVYADIHAEAVWDVRGARLVKTPVFTADSGLLTTIVTVRSTYPFTPGAVTNVIGSLDGELLRAADDADDYIALRIYILEQTAA